MSVTEAAAQPKGRRKLADLSGIVPDSIVWVWHDARNQQWRIVYDSGYPQIEEEVRPDHWVKCSVNAESEALLAAFVSVYKRLHRAELSIQHALGARMDRLSQETRQ